MASDAPGGGPYYKLRVREVIDETADARSLVFDVPEPLRGTFAYRAGQFFTFRTEVEGKRLVRCYSLSSSPGTDAAPKVTIKRVPQGRVSNWMNEHVRVGDELEVMKPAGHFCLQERDPGREILMFSAGSGITPCISIIKSALASTSRRIRLLYANRDERSIIFHRELEALAAAHPERLEVSNRLDERDGFTTVEVVKAFVRDAIGADFYICGPGPFMDIVEEGLRALGVGSEHVFIERFELPEEPEPAVEAVEPPEGASLVVVHLDGETHELHVSPNETILHAARSAGLEAPFACEDGYCGCCMAKLKEGRVEMRLNDGGVDEQQMAEGWVLTCQSEPRTLKVDIEYPD